MGDAKDLFLKQQQLREQWLAIAKTDWFRQALVYAMGELMNAPDVNTDNLKGARQYERILLGLGDDENQPPEQFPTSGLSHDLDARPRKPKVKTKDKKK
jgi:hypothetical protein